jgi:sulfur dioxygenase
MADRVFTGDTLLIRGTGRTDFQNGDPRAQYESIFNRLLKLADQTLVYPAHDYRGESVSTIGEEKAFNPRLQVQSVEQYVELMNNLKLPNPKMMDVAVPANTKIGLSQGEVARRGWAVTTAEFAQAIDRFDVAIVDIRETSEQEDEGTIPGALHVPYAMLAESLRPRGALYQTGVAKNLIFICTFGERSAMAVQLAQAVGLERARHLHGGLAEWRARDQSARRPRQTSRIPLGV